MRLSCLLPLFLATALSAATLNPLGAPLPSSYLKAVADQLLLPDPAKRAPAIARLRADGQNAYLDFSAALNRSENIAIGNLRRLMQLMRVTDPSFEAIRKEFTAYNTAKDAALVLVQTDHHKNKAKFEEMDRAFAEAEKAHKKLARLLKPGTATPATQLVDALQWAAEVHRDQDWCNGKSPDATDLPMSKVLEVEGAPAEIKAFIKELEPFIALREFHRFASAAHAQMHWAKPDQVQYAEILNERRALLGLRPYLLAEKLSEAARKHSEEMVALKYFSHESPVKENKGFGDRVKNASFDGGAGGECIYGGGSAPAGAHTGWWYSDGHRLILYATGGNAQGIGRSGGTWTFLNGSFSSFPM
jgi:uncharacterized protein YkwD